MLVDNGSMPAYFQGTDDSVEQMMEGLATGHWAGDAVFLGMQGLKWAQEQGNAGDGSSGQESGGEGSEEDGGGGAGRWWWWWCSRCFRSA